VELLCPDDPDPVVLLPPDPVVWLELPSAGWLELLDPFVLRGAGPPLPWLGPAWPVGLGFAFGLWLPVFPG
jgi:hypothetical protein